MPVLTILKYCTYFRPKLTHLMTHGATNNKNSLKIYTYLFNQHLAFMVNIINK
jgi:hypothetical protein